MDHYVERVNSSETKPAGSNETWINIARSISIGIDVISMFTSTESGHPPRPLASPAAMRKGRGFHTPYTLRPFTL